VTIASVRALVVWPAGNKAFSGNIRKEGDLEEIEPSKINMGATNALFGIMGAGGVYYYFVRLF